MFIAIIIWLNKNITLKNKFNKYNQINILFYEIKYFDHITCNLIFFSFYLTS